MAKQIRTIGFRNSLFVGEIDEYQRPDGIGIVFDDVFLTCLAHWSSSDPLDSSTQIRPSGPSVLIYPNRQILYSQNFPTNKILQGYWSYETQDYRIIGQGQSSSLAIIHLNNNIISHIHQKGHNLEHQQDLTFKDEEQKWRHVENIIGQKIPEGSRYLQTFIDSKFISEMNRSQENFIALRAKKSQILYGIVSNNQGAAFCLKQDARKMEAISVGYYKSMYPSKLMSFGRQCIDQTNSTTYKINEGNFQSQTVYSYQFSNMRPTQSYNNCRKYFRQSTHFINQFLHFAEADEIYRKLSTIKKQYIHLIGSKYGQRIIQGEAKVQQKKNVQQEQSRTDNYKETPYANREYNLQEAKARIEQQINKKKTMGSAQRTGAFLDSQKKQYPDTKTNTGQRSRQSPSPIHKYSIGQPQQTQKRLQHSPSRPSPQKKTSLKYNYTDFEIREPVINDWRKQSQRNTNNNNPNIYNQENSGNRYGRAPQQERVRNFTLYPGLGDDEFRYDRIDKYEEKFKQPSRDLEGRLDRQERSERDARVIREMEAKMARELEERLIKFDQQKELQRRRQEVRRPILGNLNNKNPQDPYNLPQSPKPEPLLLPQTYPTGNSLAYPPTLSSRNPDLKRKTGISYKYTEQQNIKTMDFKHNNEADLGSYSPAGKLNHVNSIGMREVSKSPILSRMPGARKMYSYVQ